MIFGRKLQILHDVAAHDGEWYWYQFVARLAPIDLKMLRDSIDDLARDGLIDIRRNPSLGEHPRYWITEKGRLELAWSRPVGFSTKPPSGPSTQS